MKESYDKVMLATQILIMMLPCVQVTKAYGIEQTRSLKQPDFCCSQQTLAKRLAVNSLEIVSRPSREGGCSM